MHDRFSSGLRGLKQTYGASLSVSISVVEPVVFMVARTVCSRFYLMGSMPALRVTLIKPSFCRQFLLSVVAFCLLNVVGWAEVDLSAKLRYRATGFSDFGLYEKNRQGNQSNELEHELRADVSLAHERHLLQLRLGGRLLDRDEFMRAPETDVHRIHQAYLDFKLRKSEYLNVRVGRQELSYNRGILIDADDWDLDGNSNETGITRNINCQIWDAWNCGPYALTTKSCGSGSDCGDSSCNVISDYNDWINIAYHGILEGDFAPREIIFCGP